MFTIGYGVGNVQTRDENNYRSISQVLADTSLQAALSFDPNQVDARVNGTIVDLNAGLSSNMRIELVKKAGRKSTEGAPLVLENQLRPIGVSMDIINVLDQKAAEATQPFYDNLNDAESASAKAVVVAQRDVVSECKPFKDYTQALIERLVDENFVDSVGSLTVPVAIREELAAVATAAEADLEGIRKVTAEAEAKVRAWRKSVYADISMSVTVADQRALIAKVLASDPTEAWTFEA